MIVVWAAFFTLLGLKLSDTIDWSWWIVTAPLWIVGAVTVVVLTGLAAVTAKVIRGVDR